VHIGVCAEHMQRRRNLLIVGWAMLAIGLITPVIAFANEYVGIAILGMLLVVVSAFWLVLAARVVRVKTIDDRYVWLKGIDPNYLAQFPSVQGQV
jgi:energy-converting hydrogenase Eha subunit C